MQNPSSTCPRCQSPIPADAPGGLCPSCALLGVAEPTNPSQSAAANIPTIDEVAAAFPELEVLELIGQGGMGVVFKARQPRLDRLVALKILPPTLAAQPGFAERFTREARVLARLAHPHIVAIYDFGESAGFFYLIMEFVNGVNLRAAMRAGVQPEQALLLVPHICEALQFAHDHGVLHRDIKPENILLDTTGTPKLADFGIAKFAGEESARTGLTATGAALGTAAYMAPEQIEKPATVDHRADIYSLGVVLYEMLTGELPLGRFAAPSEKSTVNPGVDEVVMRALEKERERRQQSATAMKTEVEHVSAARQHSPLPPPAAPPKQKDLGVAYLCWFLFGVCGLHKFYLRRIGWGFLYFFTGGLFLVGWFVDLFTLPGQVRRYNEEARNRPPTPPQLPQAAAPNSWPLRVFLILVAVIAVLGLIAFGMAMPYFLARKGAPRVSAEQSRIEAALDAEAAQAWRTIPSVPPPPHSETLGDNLHSAYILRSDRTLVFLLWRDGSFKTTSTSANYESLDTWNDGVRAELPNGTVLNFSRTSAEPFHLIVGPHRFDLRKGRVFVVGDDGSVIQRPIQTVKLRDPLDLPAFAARLAQPEP